MLPFVQVRKDPPLYDKAEKGYRKRSQDHRHPETGCAPSEPFGYTECDEGSDHIQGAVRNVRDPEHPENERQAGRDDKQNGRPAQTYKDLA